MKNLKELIRKNRIVEVINELLKYQQYEYEVINIETSYSNNETGNRINIITHDEYATTYSKIVRSLLSIISELEKNNKLLPEHGGSKIISIYIDYDDTDRQYVQELRKHLSPLVNNKLVTLTGTFKLNAGTDVNKFYEEAIVNCDIFIGVGNTNYMNDAEKFRIAKTLNKKTFIFFNKSCNWKLYKWIESNNLFAFQHTDKSKLITSNGDMVLLVTEILTIVESFSQPTPAEIVVPQRSNNIHQPQTNQHPMYSNQNLTTLIALIKKNKDNISRSAKKSITEAVDTYTELVVKQAFDGDFIVEDEKIEKAFTNVIGLINKAVKANSKTSKSLKGLYNDLDAPNLNKAKLETIFNNLKTTKEVWGHDEELRIFTKKLKDLTTAHIDSFASDLQRFIRRIAKKK